MPKRFLLGPKARIITAWGTAPGKYRKQKLEGLKARTIESDERKHGIDQ